MYDIKAAVAKGAKLLDEHYGTHWRSDVDVDRLDMGSLENCVLGQLYEFYGTGLIAIGMTTSWGTAHYSRADEFGFSVDGAADDRDLPCDAVDALLAQLRDEWVREVNRDNLLG